jgi:NADH-quinone oxidoreductase subunit G
MTKLIVDGKEIDVPPEYTLLQACEAAGAEIPRFCYHERLSIAGNCRMCLIEVVGTPKPQASCAMGVKDLPPKKDGTPHVLNTKTPLVRKAREGVMEFLLINHPLDCPICDQGGECDLQDQAMAYGVDASRFQENKRAVEDKYIGALVKTIMNRCIHCTRCIRFTTEVAGVADLGAIGRGEDMEITTYLEHAMSSELQGNVVDLCPVGALTSKPFRYSARPWELSRRKSIAPHDSEGANIIVQVKNNKVMRVLPLENDEVNECWIADRERFSYEALNGPERLTSPMLKQGGEWKPVDWQTALEYVANGVKQIKQQHGGQAVGALVSPHSTVEELFLAGQLMRGLGSENVDHRLRHAEFTTGEGVRWLGTSIASLSTLERALVIGSNLRKDHPLFALRVRYAVRNGAQVSVVHDRDNDWAMALQAKSIVPAGQWTQALADIATAIGNEKGEKAPLQGNATDAAKAIAASLLSGERKAILLGNAAAHHPAASSLLALASWIGEMTGATVGYLTEAANTVGAQLVNAIPGEGGLNAAQMLAGGLKAVFLLNTEPEFDSAAGAKAADALAQADMVVTLSPFKANLAFSDVLLPIAPWTETPGTFVNAEGRVQSFHAVVKPLGEARPAWKVLRVLGNMLGLPGFDYESAQEVLVAARGKEDAEQAFVQGGKLSNKTAKAAWLGDTDARPVSAGIYQLDSIVRRAPALQLTADARIGRMQAEEVKA